jgi:putative endonuclease
MYYTYVLLSEKNNKLYIGFTKDLKKRLQEQNNGKVCSAASMRSMNLIYYEACLTTLIFFMNSLKTDI